MKNRYLDQSQYGTWCLPQRIMASLMLVSVPWITGQTGTPSIRYEPIAPGVWLHLSVSGGIPSNGLIVDTSDGVILVDTPWDNGQTKELLDWVSSELNKLVSLAIVTHSHDDRAGGVLALTAAGIPIIGASQSAEIVKREQGVTLQGVVSKTKPIYQQEHLEVFFPGAGHTRDNIVVWLPQHSVLFGGCLLKSATSQHMGYVREADIVEWPKSINRMAERYPNAKTLVPGHGPLGGRDTIDNTLRLLTEHIRKELKNRCAGCEENL